MDHSTAVLEMKRSLRHNPGHFGTANMLTCMHLQDKMANTSGPAGEFWGREPVDIIMDVAFGPDELIR